MFVGRARELAKLEEMYASDKYEMGIIYGRRRVGKSEMIKHFCFGKRTVFFTAVENSAENNVFGLFSAVSTIKAPPRVDFDAILQTLIEICKEEKTIIVIDEYPYLAKVVRHFSSLLQKYIDHNFKNINCMIILCGSSMNFMERQVMSYKSPLYGRRTAQFKVEPFDYHEAALFTPKYSNVDRAIAYGAFGGTPFYLSRVNDSRSLKNSIYDLFFQKEALLFEEPANLIKQELREPMMYNAIITAIANGATKLSEIANQIGKATNQTETYLKNLISLGLCAKELPLGEKLTSRKGIYMLKDNMFKFWFRFVQNNLSLIYGGQNERAFETTWQFLDGYMGHIFENICIQYLWHNYKSLPIQPKDIGRWWGNNPLERREEEIDILATDGDSAIFGECKFRSDRVGIDVLENLERKSKIFNHPTKYLYLFSKSGFTEQLLQLAKERNNIRLISLDDIYSLY